MTWSPSDEQLYQALALEQRLSTDGASSFALQSDQPDVPCDISEIVLEKTHTDFFFLKPRARWLADPFNPLYLTLLILWIPAMILYSGFQLIRFLVTMRFVIGRNMPDTARIAPAQIYFGSRHSWGDSLFYKDMSSLGYYTNGLQINYGNKKLLLATSAAPWLFVALTHLAPTASIKSGLSVPADFIGRCSAERATLDVNTMRINSPSSWRPEPRAFRPPVPVWRVVGYVIAVALIVLIFIG